MTDSKCRFTILTASKIKLTLLHSERPKLYRPKLYTILAFLSAIGSNKSVVVLYLGSNSHGQFKSSKT